VLGLPNGSSVEGDKNCSGMPCRMRVVNNEALHKRIMKLPHSPGRSFVNHSYILSSGKEKRKVDVLRTSLLGPFIAVGVRIDVAQLEHHLADSSLSVGLLLPTKVGCGQASAVRRRVMSAEGLYYCGFISRESTCCPPTTNTPFATQPCVAVRASPPILIVESRDVKITWRTIEPGTGRTTGALADKLLWVTTGDI
jgi:hypothetical protein